MTSRTMPKIVKSPKVIPVNSAINRKVGPASREDQSGEKRVPKR
jgi:hypothetical protein